ncbi:hypothetical protein BJF79_05880 [Actinomadura sp. CNU-125]|uniref:hypothetical protein n=1 Tax=Actinomadura sp. CNU-125 TaxID=1904961 RepID=UPI00095DF981|nr:hypothetical protein [Actinomadura sp. CNU-125]OLT37737.1 hypothetical protein BJF79_05880 [Actinomadura sp. CNU-125]
MQPVSCHLCGSCVLVKKNSLAHTEVQWTTDTNRCLELNERAERGVLRGTVPTCLQLRDSIEASVRAGAVRVPVPDLEYEDGGP